MPTVEGFLIRYPVFNNVNTGYPKRLKMLLSDAMLEVSQKHWKHLYEQGVYALMAHMLVIGYGNDGMGDGSATPKKEVTSKSAGALSIGYGSERSGFDDTFGTYASTTYGQRYLELLALIQPTLMVI